MRVVAVILVVVVVYISRETVPFKDGREHQHFFFLFVNVLVLHQTHITRMKGKMLDGWMNCRLAGRMGLDGLTNDNDLNGNDYICCSKCCCCCCCCCSPYYCLQNTKNGYGCAKHKNYSLFFSLFFWVFFYFIVAEYINIKVMEWL